MSHLNRKAYPARGTKSRTQPFTVVKRTLAAAALELRREGLTNGEIARRLSADGSSTLSEDRVGELIRSELDALTRPAAEAVRQEELDRLDRLFNRAYRISMGDGNRDRVPAIGAALKAMERRAALLGLDAPKAVDIKDDRQHTPPQAAREAVLDRLVAEAGAEEPG